MTHTTQIENALVQRNDKAVYLGFARARIFFSIKSRVKLLICLPDSLQ